MKQAEKIIAGQLMADFLGWKEKSIEHLQFYKSWDWLHLVIEKIESTVGAQEKKYEFTIAAQKWGCHVSDWRNGVYRPPHTIVAVMVGKEPKKERRRSEFEIFKFAPNKKESAFICCYEFIKWHKKNHPTK